MAVKGEEGGSPGNTDWTGFFAVLGLVALFIIGYIMLNIV